MPHLYQGGEFLVKLVTGHLTVGAVEISARDAWVVREAARAFCDLHRRCKAARLGSPTLEAMDHRRDRGKAGRGHSKLPA